MYMHIARHVHKAVTEGQSVPLTEDWEVLGVVVASTAGVSALQLHLMAAHTQTHVHVQIIFF